MKILFSTLVLDGMPFLPLIYAELRKLPKEIEWQWWVIEGTALPEGCTSWVARMEPRLSNDGTTEWLSKTSAGEERVKYMALHQWRGKRQMVNFPLYVLDQAYLDKHRNLSNADLLNHLEEIFEEVLLWQMDSDELFTAEQIVTCYQMFREHPEKNAAFFWCRYYVGPDKVITTRNCFGNNSSYEWHRVWKIRPGMLFRTHEPPVIDGLRLNPFTHAETEARGLVFQHFAYATRAQVEFKEQYYAGPNNPNAASYRGLTERWEKFQNETVWPRSLKEVMPWAEAGCMVDKA